MKLFSLIISSLLFISNQSFAVKLAETADNYYLVVGISDFECESCEDEDSDSSRLLVINKRTHTESSILIGHDTERHDPTAIALWNNKACITFRNSNSLCIVDLTTLTLEKTINRIGNEPVDIAILGDKAFIKNDSKNLTIFDLQTETVIRRLNDTPLDLKLHPYNGTLYGVSYRQGLFTIDPITFEQKHILPGTKMRDVKFQENHALILQNGTIDLFDLSTKMVIASTGDDHKFIKFFLVNDHAVALTNKCRIYELNKETLCATKKMCFHKQRYVGDTFHVQGNLGYLYKSSTHKDVKCAVIDLNTYSVLGTGAVPCESPTFEVNSDGTKGRLISISSSSPDFYTDAFAYANGNRLFPLCPTLASLVNSSITQIVNDLKSMRPNAFAMGEIKPRDYPAKENEFDQMPPYLLAQDLFWDAGTNIPHMDPVDILATLATMKYPQRYLQTVAGQWLRKRLHMALLQTIWLGQTKKSQDMLKYFIQLKDPMIAKFETYKLVKTKVTPSGAANSDK